MKNIIVLLFFFFFFACVAAHNVKIANGQPPIIKQVFTTETVRPATDWKVYLEVEDPNGDLDKIYVFIYQTGIGMYSPWVAKLSKKYAFGLKGYLSLYIPDYMWGSKLTIEIFFKDKAGHKSSPVYFPLKVVYKKTPLIVPLDFKHYLGRIEIILRSSLFDEYKAGRSWIWGK